MHELCVCVITPPLPPPPLLTCIGVSRCTPGTKPDPDCDPTLEAEVVKPEKCGKIKDPTGPFR